MQVVVDSMLTRYEQLSKMSGKAALDKRPAIVILHGWGDDSRGWRDFGNTLAAAYDVYIVDLPGFGGTDSPARAWGLDDYATFVGHYLTKIGVRPYAILGHSNGGAIAIRGLARASIQAEKLVLLASAGVRSEYKGRNQALRLVAKTGKLLATPLPSGVKHRLRRKLYVSVGSDMLVAEHLQETFKKVVSDDVQADAAQLAIPTLLIYGQNDVATPPNFGRLLHEKIDGSTLEIIGHAEHFVHIDQPSKVLALVKEFLG